MTEFFRFPHTPHLAWLGHDEPRGDKRLSHAQAHEFLSDDVVVAEKIDGANLGFSLDDSGRLRVQNRGQYLVEPFHGQFTRLSPWLALHADTIANGLHGLDLILFGEWCAAQHSLAYDRLPDFFIAFDVYHRGLAKFWSSKRRNALVRQLGLICVPDIATGRMTLAQLRAILTTQPSSFRRGSMEGLVIKRETPLWCMARAKLVDADFTQTINEHWRSHAINWNVVRPALP